MSSPEAEAVAQVADRIRSRFPQVDPAAIAEAVARCHRAYDGRPIRDFVPLLVEQDVLVHLQRVPTQAPPFTGGSGVDAGARELERT